MRKLFLTTLMIGMVFTAAIARQLTPAEAISRIKTTVQAKAVDGSAVQPINSYSLVYSSSKDGNSTYYVYNSSNGGFLVLSADDCMPAVLMASDSDDTFDIDKIPSNMRWWLSQYDAAVSERIASSTTYRVMAERDVVAPLLKEIAWNQGYPYNLDCPTYKDSIAYTGCVATAMAQIMKYHGYPSQGIGDHSYSYIFNGSCQKGTKFETVASSDFSSHTYQWDLMLDNYDKAVSPSQDQREEVAKLMYDCGVASEMVYGTLGSGASAAMAAQGLLSYFGYDKSLKFCLRAMYPDSVWEDMIYNEIANNRPVLYGGNDAKNGGHEFVLDGYDGEGKYHVNWGWGGSMNCYCLLSSANQKDVLYSVSEDGQDTNGSFYIGQDAVINIKPDEGGSTDYSINMYATSCKAVKYDDSTGKMVEASSYARGEEELYLSGEFLNGSYLTQDYAVGVKLEGTHGTYYTTSAMETFKPGQGYSWYNSMLYNVLKNGTYTVTPVFKNLSRGDTQWRDMMIADGVVLPTIEVTGVEPALCITEMPVVTSNGQTTSDNQVVKTATGVDLNISVKVKSLLTISPTKRSIYAFIYAPEGGSNVASEYIDITSSTSSQFKQGTENTLVFTPKSSSKLDALEVGSTYFVELKDVYKYSGNYQFSFIPDIEYNAMEFTVVNEITGIENVTIDGNGMSAYQKAARKMLRDGKLVIIKNGCEYSVEGVVIKK